MQWTEANVNCTIKLYKVRPLYSTGLGHKTEDTTNGSLYIILLDSGLNKDDNYHENYECDFDSDYHQPQHLELSGSWEICDSAVSSPARPILREMLVETTIE